MTKNFKVLVVCTGNICRSPIAAYLIQKLVGNPEDSGIEVSSAGTWAGNDVPATQMMVDIAEGWGIDLATHRSRPVTYDLIDSVDLILAMTPNHYNEICTKTPEAAEKVKMFGEPIGEEKIPDPYADSSHVYGDVAQMIYRGAEGWADLIIQLNAVH